MREPQSPENKAPTPLKESQEFTRNELHMAHMIDESHPRLQSSKSASEEKGEVMRDNEQANTLDSSQEQEGVAFEGPSCDIGDD